MTESVSFTLTVLELDYVKLEFTRLGENPINRELLSKMGTKVPDFAGTFYVFENKVLKNIMSSVRNVFVVYLAHYSFHKNFQN